MAKYKVGDTVVIKNLDDVVHWNLNSPMREMKGQTFQITELPNDSPWYRLSNGYVWLETWFEPAQTSEINVSEDDLMELLHE